MRPRPLSGIGDLQRWARDVDDFLATVEPISSTDTLLARRTRGASRSALAIGSGAAGESGTLQFKGEWLATSTYLEGDIVIRGATEALDGGEAVMDDGNKGGTYIAEEDIEVGDVPPGEGESGVTALATGLLDETEVLLGINMVDGGTSYKVAPSVTITSATGSGATAHAVLGSDGSVASIVVDTGGSGYEDVTITIDAPTGTQKWKDFARGRWQKLTHRVGSQVVVVDAGRDDGNKPLIIVLVDKDDNTVGTIELDTQDLIDICPSGYRHAKFRVKDVCEDVEGTPTAMQQAFLCTEPWIPE
jgi:hypothetical protein